MKRILLFLLFASAAFGQMSSTGSISASGTNCFTTNACISLHLINSVNASTANATITISGSFTGTLQFEASGDGTNYVAITGTPVPSGAGVTSATAAGVWTFSIAAFTDLRVRASAFSANSATVTIQSSTISQTIVNNITQGGGGSGSTSAIDNNAWYLSQNCNGQARCTQIKGDLKYITDGTSNSTTTFTCPNSDCNFAQSDVGKTFWATTQGTGLAGFLIYTTYVCPITTIASVQGASQITLNLACTANGTANVAAYWGTKDGAALASLDAAVGCSVVHVPGNLLILDDQPFFNNAPACASISGVTGILGAPGPSLVGDGYGASQGTIVISPDFNWANCVTISGASNPVCIGGSSRTLANLQIWGTGLTSASNATGCSGAANKVMVANNPTTGGVSYGVDIAGICPGASGMRGYEWNADDQIFEEGGVQEVGTVACAAHGAHNVHSRGNDCHNINVSGGNGVVVDANSLLSDFNSIPMSAVLVQANGTYHARSVHLVAGNANSNAITVNAGKWVDFSSFVGVDTAWSGTPTNAATVSGTAQLSGTTFKATSEALINNGTVNSLGGNFTAGGGFQGTGTWTGSGILIGTCRGTATSSATLGLYGLGQFSTPACTSTTVNQGVEVPVVPLSGSVLMLNVQAGTGCKSGNTCVFTVMKNNSANPSTPVATALTCSLVGPAASCQDTTHFDVPAAGDTYSIQFTTGATETLANVRATVVAW